VHLFPLFWRKMRVRRYMTENNKAQKLMKIGKTYKTALSAATAADRAASRIHHNQHPPSSRPQARGRCVRISGPGVKPQWESRGQSPWRAPRRRTPRRGAGVQRAAPFGAVRRGHHQLSLRCGGGVRGRMAPFVCAVRRGHPRPQRTLNPDGGCRR